MVKGFSNNTLIFGLSDLNIQKLKQGQPIFFNLSALGLEDRNVLIFTEETEEKCMETLKKEGLITPGKTFIIPKEPENN